MQRAALALLALTLFACGQDETGPEAARAALARGDYQVALSGFEAALEGRSSSDPGYLALRVDHARTLAYVDAGRVPPAVSRLAGEVTLSAVDYRSITTELFSAGALVPAIEIMHQGKLAFPEDEKMDVIIELLKDESMRGGDSAAIDALKGGGYW